MTLFRRHTPLPITEQDLLALHLRELPPDRLQIVRAALAQDPALAAESAQIAATLFGLGNPAMPLHQEPTDAAVLERNWQAIRPSLAVHTPVALGPHRWLRPLLAGGLLTAAAATLVFSSTHRHANPAAGSLAVNTSPATDPNRDDPQPGQPPAHIQPRTRSGFDASLSGGVFHPPGNKTDTTVHFLALAPTDPTGLTPHSLLSAPPRGVPLPRITAEPQPEPLSSGLSQAQEAPTARNTLTLQPASAPSHRTATDLMLAVGGTFIASHASVSATHAILAQGAFHQQFRPFLGYRLTASYSRPELKNTNSLNETSGTNARIYELAGTYVLLGPHRNRITSTVDAGGAFMAFLPDASQPYATSVVRGAGVLGLNVDYAISRHLGARFAYRAQIFRSPSFPYPDGSFPSTHPLLVDNEPSLGLTYTFGKKPSTTLKPSTTMKPSTTLRSKP